MKKILAYIALGAGLISAAALIVLGVIYVDETVGKLGAARKVLMEKAVNFKLPSKFIGGNR